MLCNSLKNIKLPTTYQTLNLKVNSINFNLYKYFYLHSFFFQYRPQFFKQEYTLIGDKTSDLQLTYMDSVWDELSNVRILKTEVNSNKLNTKSFNLYIRSLSIKFTQKQVIKLLLHLCKRPVKAFIHNRLPLKYLNSYSNFLRVRASNHKRSLLQTVQLWYVHNYKKSILQKNTYVTQSKLKFSRRGKIRNLKTTYNSQLPLKTQQPKYQHNIALSKSKPLLFHNNSYPFKKKHFRKNTLPQFMSLPLRRKSINSTYKFTDKQILNRYKTHYLRKTLLDKPKLLDLVIKRSVKKVYWLTSLVSTDWKFNKVKLNLLKLYTPFESEFLNFKSQAFKSFILRNKGLYIISKLSWHNEFPVKLKSQFKKKLFSFIYPGQSKKNVLLRRKKQVLTRLLSNSFRLINSVDRFSYQLYYQLFKVNQYTNEKYKVFNNNKNSNTLSYSMNLRNIYYNFDYQTKGVDVSDLYIHSEVRIPRVRFKPGYQRIWRQVRTALKVSLNVKFQYQQQLTKYLIKFYHLSSKYLLSYSESTLDKIVVYSHLLPDMSTTQLFSINGFLYLNGSVTNSLSTVVIKNDLVQLVVSIWYYSITRWFLNWTNDRVRKFKRLVYRKNKPLQYKVMKNKKQQSYYTPNWIYQTRYDNTDVKPYLEVDFFTLSVFILTDTYIQYYHKVDDMPDLRNSTYMLYNWKYIT